MEKEKKSLLEYMNEQRLINRWTILQVGLWGMFAGITLATVFFLRAII